MAVVGVPAEFFTGLGVDLKRRSPIKHTYIAELSNDWIGYLPDREAHELGGYQVWTGIGGTGVVGQLVRGTSSRAIGLRADMDALPIV